MLSGSIMDRLRRLDHKITIAYLYINLAADDDGVCQAVDSALAGTGCGEDEINALIDLGFILRHPEQPYRVLVSHWMLHNTIPASRKARCGNDDFIALVTVKNGVYCWKHEKLKDESG